jgi:hypothetical protein
VSPQHIAQIQQAGRAMRKVRRAVLTAKIDGWSVGVFGGLTALIGLTDAEPRAWPHHARGHVRQASIGGQAAPVGFEGREDARLESDRARRIAVYFV